RLAGVSPATVSRVLNGNQQVAKELRERVHRAAAQVGYRAASPRRSRAALRQVGLIVPHVSSPFYCQVLAGVEREACQRGYDLLFFTTAGRSHRNVIERVPQAPPVAGLVVMTAQIGTA